MTEYNEFTSFIDDELERVADLFAEKQQQYSAGADPLSNFRTGRDMVVYGLIMLYMVKKNQELAQVKE